MAQLRCCIVVCRNSKVEADQRVGYHPFPADETLRAKWIEFVGVANPERFQWQNMYVCSEHFFPSKLAEGSGSGGAKSLLDGAIPMVFVSKEEADVHIKKEVSDEPPGEAMEAKFTPPEPIVSSMVEEVELRALFCRICLKKQPDLLPLGSKLHNMPLSDVIFTIAGIRLEVDSQLPTKICARCIEKADMAFKVRMEFIHCEEILKNLIKNKQLKNHYQSYDHQPYKTHSINEDPLNTLHANVEQEVLEPKLEFNHEDPELAIHADEDESNFEKHLYEEADKSHEILPESDGAESSYGHPLSLPPSESMQNIHEANSGNGFTCDYCGMFFGAKTKFRNHMAKHRAVEEGRYKCEYCDQAFCNSSLLKRHRRIIHTETLWRSTHPAGLSLKDMMNFKPIQNAAGGASYMNPAIKISWPIRDNKEFVRLENAVRDGDAEVTMALVNLFEQRGNSNSPKLFINSIIKNLFGNERYTWTGRPPNNCKGAPQSHAAQGLRITEILIDLTLQKFPFLILDSVIKLMKACLNNKNDLDRKNAAKIISKAVMVVKQEET